MHLLYHTMYALVRDRKSRSRFYESSQQRYANVATVTWLARHFETVEFSITSSSRARPSNWANAELYLYKIVAVSLHITHICVVKSLVKIAAVSWHNLRRFIKPAPALLLVLVRRKASWNRLLGPSPRARPIPLSCTTTSALHDYR